MMLPGRLQNAACLRFGAGPFRASPDICKAITWTWSCPWPHSASPPQSSRARRKSPKPGSPGACRHVAHSVEAAGLLRDGFTTREGPAQRQSLHQLQVPRWGGFALHELQQNYPKLFNPTTRTAFSVLETGAVQLLICNLQGQEVRTRVFGQMNSGRHTVNWDGSDNAGNIMPRGVHLYKLHVHGFEETREMTLMKQTAVQTAFHTFKGRSGFLTALLCFAVSIH